MSNVDNDDMEEEVVQIPHASQPVAALLTPMTPRHGSAQGPSTQVASKLHRQVHQEDSTLHQAFHRGQHQQNW